MPHLEYFLVAESASIDQMTNRVSVFNVLEDVQALQFPVTIPQLIAVAAWNIAPEELGREYQAALTIELPGGVAPLVQRSNFTATRRRQRLFNMFVGVPVTQAGDVRCVLHLNEEPAATHTMTVVLADVGAGAERGAATN